MNLRHDDNPLRAAERGATLLVPGRPDARGHEIRKGRPWSILRDADTRHVGWGVCAPRTHAHGRGTGPCLVPDVIDAPTSFVDAQQLWTLHGGFFRPSFVPPVDRPWLRRVDDFLSGYLAFAEGPRISPLCQGRVVGLNLAPNATVGDRLRADHAWRRNVEALLGVPAGGPGDWTLPAMIVSHDAFNERTHSPAPLSLVTVVPLVRVLADTPTSQRVLSPPRAPDERHTALSLILLTVDPRTNAPDSRHRISMAHPKYGDWIIGDSDRREILDDARSAAGLEEGLP